MVGSAFMISCSVPSPDKTTTVTGFWAFAMSSAAFCSVVVAENESFGAMWFVKNADADLSPATGLMTARTDICSQPPCTISSHSSPPFFAQPVLFFSASSVLSFYSQTHSDRFSDPNTARTACNTGPLLVVHLNDLSVLFAASAAS